MKRSCVSATSAQFHQTLASIPPTQYAPVSDGLHVIWYESPVTGDETVIGAVVSLS